MENIITWKKLTANGKARRRIELHAGLLLKARTGPFTRGTFSTHVSAKVNMPGSHGASESIQRVTVISENQESSDADLQ